MYEGTLSLHCLSLSSVKAGSSDLIRGLIFNEGSQRRTRGGEGGYWLVDLCEMAVASPDKNRGERERERDLSSIQVEGVRPFLSRRRR